ncbi:MAG TPA: outer membrane beta-barrel protein [Rhizomicrobium sp.]|nr:outer membrane beta-barrel protein [Rhizomicrobium sp.]
MKHCIAAAGLAAAIAVAGSAHAQSTYNGFYTVINYTGAFPDFKKALGISTPSYLDGVEANVGWRFNRFYTMEASYDYYSGSTHTPGGPSFNTTLQEGSLDALGYLPLGPWRSWSLYGDIGGTWYSLSSNGVGFLRSDRWGGRAGGGVQFQIDDDLGVRLGGRYEWMDMRALKSMEVFSVGLVWQR